MADAVISYTRQIIQNAQDLNVTAVANGVNVTYGDWTGSPLHKASNSSFTIRYNSISQVLNANNSVTVSFTAVVGTLTRTVVNASVQDTATVTATLDGTHFWNHTESIIVNSSLPGYTKTFSVTVPPLGTSNAAMVHFYNDMSAADDEFRVGMRIYNPNPPDYRPGMQRHSGVWQSHNRGVGRADKRQSGSWQTMRTENGPNGTGNPPSIRRSSAWRNQSKIGNNAG